MWQCRHDGSQFSAPLEHSGDPRKSSPARGAKSQVVSDRTFAVPFSLCCFFLLSECSYCVFRYAGVFSLLLLCVSATAEALLHGATVLIQKMCALYLSKMEHIV